MSSSPVHTGNVHLIPQVPTEKHVYYNKLAQEYGDVFTLKVSISQSYYPPSFLVLSLLFSAYIP